MKAKTPPLIIQYGTKVYQVSKKDFKAYNEVIERFRLSTDSNATQKCVEEIRDIAYKYKPIGKAIFSYEEVLHFLEAQIKAVAMRYGRLRADADELTIIKAINSTKLIKFGLYEQKQKKKSIQTDKPGTRTSFSSN